MPPSQSKRDIERKIDLGRRGADRWEADDLFCRMNRGELFDSLRPD
jgi:hypothetical protein